MNMMSSLKKWRTITYLSIFTGWGLYMLVRKTLPSSMQSLIQHNIYTKDSIGLIASSFSLSYGLSKFIFSFVSDHVSPRRLFISGLLLTSFCCVLFPACNGVAMACVVWFIAGIVQGCGWAPCVILLKTWYSPSQIGTWWSILSAAGSIASALSPLIILYITTMSDWTVSYYLIGIITFVLGCVMVYTIKDSPEEIGIRSDFVRTKENTVKSSKNDGNWYSVFMIFDLWVVALIYASVYLINYGVLGWMQLFLVEVAKKSDAMAAASVSVFQVGGMVGNITTGYVSDLLLVKRARLCPRAPVLFLLTLLLVVATHMYRTSAGEDTPEILWSVITFSVGFLTDGITAIIGLCGMEVAPQHMTGSAHGFVSAIAQVGSVLAGWPMAYVMGHYSWSTAYWLLELVSVSIVISCLYLMWVMMKSREPVGRTKTH